MIRLLEIHNFRCFRSTTLNDLRRFTIITGANGSGKTAFLESLFVAGGASPELYLRANAWRGRDTVGLTVNSLLPLFEDFFHQFDSTTGMRIRFVDSNGDEREVRVTVGSAEVLSLPFDRKAAEAVPSRDLKFTWKTPKGQIESKVEITADGILRMPQPEDVFFMLFLNSSTIGARENADRWSALSQKNMEEPVRQIVASLFPEVQELSVLTSSGTPAIHVKVRGVSRKIPVGLLSAGVTKFIAILVAIGSAPKGAVLIDEIENGLYYKLYHDMWKAISHFAAENNTQIFATTHSKEFLEAITPVVAGDQKDYSLLRLEKKNGEVRTLGFTGQEFAGALEQGFEVR